jgi:hypothetical protein
VNYVSREVRSAAALVGGTGSTLIYSKEGDGGFADLSDPSIREECDDMEY